MLREWMTLYAAHRTGSDASLAPPALQLADYAAWQRNWLLAGEMERQIDGWRARLGDGGAPLTCPPTAPDRPPRAIAVPAMW